MVGTSLFIYIVERFFNSANTRAHTDQVSLFARVGGRDFLGRHYRFDTEISVTLENRRLVGE